MPSLLDHNERVSLALGFLSDHMQVAGQPSVAKSFMLEFSIRILRTGHNNLCSAVLTRTKPSIILRKMVSKENCAGGTSGLQRPSGGVWGRELIASSGSFYSKSLFFSSSFFKASVLDLTS